MPALTFTVTDGTVDVELTDKDVCVCSVIDNHIHMQRYFTEILA
jgi:hypothetical protein